MKIGILTFHRAYNYGAVLQCYALQQYLLSLGHDVEIIDYRQKWIEACFKPFSWVMFKYNMRHPRLMYRYIITFLKRKKMLETRKQHFEHFRLNFLNISKTPILSTKDISENYNAIIIGSDQVWGRWCLGNQLDQVYLGKFPHSSKTKIIGYSIGSDISSVNLANDKNGLKNILQGFSHISFRENNIVTYIKQLTGLQYPQTVDPTLLCDEKLWSSLIKDEWAGNNYIVIYQVRGIEQNKSVLYEKAKILADKIHENCSIIDLSDMNYSVADFVSIIKFARFVVTTSFHATVFSIVFKTPFYSIKLNDGRDNRYENLCRTLSLSNQCIDKNFDKLETSVDFSGVEEKLSKISFTSKEFIDNSLLI